ncbi:MAG TPA: glycosyltransferase, partial [Arcobacter sp.]|nr:glycosyltransferase [Arcobacter sp.]
MARKKIIYIVSPRSAFSSNPGRKISSIIELWKKKYEVITFFGGDILGGTPPTASNYGNADVYEKSYRKSAILEPLVHTVSELKDIIHNIKSYQFLQEKYGNEKIDLIWERSSRLHFAGLLFAKKHKLPYVLEWKDNLVNYKFSFLKPIALYYEHYKCSHADKIVVESQVLKDYLSKEGIDSEKIIVAHNASDSSVFIRDEILGLEYRKGLGINNETVLIGYLGSYAFYHDSVRLVLAAQILKERGYENKIKFLMVGNGKEYKQCLEAAKETKVLGNILIMKEAVPKEEVPKILSAIDISVLPGSTDIISPIKVLEYMVSETAVIVPDYACNREVIEDGINGLLFEAKNELDLADTIESLILQSERIKPLGEKAKVTVIQKFSWESTWGKALDDIMRKKVSMKLLVINALSALRGGGQTYIINFLDHLPEGDFKVLLLVNSK